MFYGLNVMIVLNTNESFNVSVLRIVENDAVLNNDVYT